jgi:hypothetical protein
MTWTSPAAKHRDLERDWMKLRGRFRTIGNLTHRYAGWFPDVDRTEMPSNQFASADEMQRAGWRMDNRRDADGRLIS